MSRGYLPGKDEFFDAVTADILRAAVDGKDER
jgi:hypothetical protein